MCGRLCDLSRLLDVYLKLCHALVCAMYTCVTRVLVAYYIILFWIVSWFWKNSFLDNVANPVCYSVINLAWNGTHLKSVIHEMCTEYIDKYPSVFIVSLKQFHKYSRKHVLYILLMHLILVWSQIISTSALLLTCPTVFVLSGNSMMQYKGNGTANTQSCLHDFHLYKSTNYRLVNRFFITCK